MTTNNGNASSCCNSECCDCNVIPSALLDAIPKHYEKLTFDKLVDGEDYSHNFIVGKVEQTFPISKRVNGFFRKLVLSGVPEIPSPDDNGKKLTVFILNEFREQLASIDQKGYLAIAAFKVEKLTSKSNDDTLLPVQVLVIIQTGANEATMMWIARSLSASQSEKESCSQPISQDTNLDSSESDDSPSPQEINNDNLPPQSVPESASRSYSYVHLDELKESVSLDHYFHVYGIVVNCYFKPNSVDRDKQLQLMIKDSTVENFKCRVTGKNSANFPDIYPGDIVRIHRLTVDKFRDSLKGKCFSPKFIVVFGGTGEDFDARCVAKTYVFTDRDKAKIKELRQFISKQYEAIPISDINVNSNVHIMGQLVSVYSVRNDMVLLKVWDGTKSKIFSTERFQSYVCGKVDKKLLDIAKTFLVPIWVYGDYCIRAAELQPCQYIKLNDVHVYYPKSSPSQPKMSIHSQFKEERGIELLDENSEAVQQLKKRLEDIQKELTKETELTLGDSDSFLVDVDTSKMILESANQAAAKEASNAANLISQALITSLNEGIEPVESSQVMSSLNQGIEPVESSQLSQVMSSLNQRIEPVESSQLSQVMSSLNQGIKPVESSQHSSVISLNQGIEPVAGSQLFTGESDLQNKIVAATNKVLGKRLNTDDLNSDVLSKKQKTHDLDSENPTSPIIPIIHESLVRTRPKSLSLDLSSNRTEPEWQSAPAVPDPTYQTVIPENSIPQCQQEEPIDCDRPSTSTAIPVVREASLTTYSESPSRDRSQSRSKTQPEWWKSVRAMSGTVGHDAIEPVILKSVLNHYVPYKFRVFVTVLNIDPPLDSIQKLIRLYCPSCHYVSRDAEPDIEIHAVKDGIPLYFCPICKNQINSTTDGASSILEYIFLAYLSLQDGSAMLNVFLWKENAIKFFRGITPELALKEKNIAAQILKMLCCICPNCCPSEFEGGLASEVFANREGPLDPVLDCCILSYTAGGCVRYQLFDTELK